MTETKILLDPTSERSSAVRASDEFPEILIGAIVVLGQQRVRVRRLPIGPTQPDD